MVGYIVIHLYGQTIFLNFHQALVPFLYQLLTNG